MRYIILVVTSLIYSIASYSQKPDTKILQLGLPVVVINTIDDSEPTADDAVTPTGCWGATVVNKTTVSGHLFKYDCNGNLLYDSGEYGENSGMTIKLHGNWSARSDKKAFKIKLVKKDDLLSRNNKIFKDKEFLLLHPEASTKYSTSPITMQIGYWMNKLMKMPWTPETEYVNLVFNGDYRGLYAIVESVKRNEKCRINVDEIHGFIAELDPYYWKEDFSLPTLVYKKYTMPLQYTFKYPDDDNIKLYIGDIAPYMYKFENSLKTKDYTNFIDEDNWARWIMAHDIMGTSDAAGSNFFVSKYDMTDSEKLIVGPLWDFDSIEQVHKDWCAAHYYPYWVTLFQNNFFANKYKSIYTCESNNIFESLFSLLDSLETSTLMKAINQSVKADQERWPQYNLKDAYSALKDSKDWFTSRQQWMDLNVNNIGSGIDQIVNDDNVDDNANLYYNLCGQLVGKSYKGVKILKTGKKKIQM